MRPSGRNAIVVAEVMPGTTTSLMNPGDWAAAGRTEKGPARAIKARERAKQVQRDREARGEVSFVAAEAVALVPTDISGSLSAEVEVAPSRLSLEGTTPT